jgi:hypothetical protein
LSTVSRLQELMESMRGGCEDTIDLPATDRSASDRAVLAQIDRCKALLRDIDELEEKKSNAFGIEIALPYVRSRTFDTLSLGDAWPFLPVGVVVVFIVTGSRRRAYEKILAHWNAEKADEGSVRVALAEFLVGDLKHCPARRCGVYVYQKPPALLPESGILILLLCALALESDVIIFSYDPMVIHGVDSLFYGYFPLLSAMVWFGILLVVRARKYFDSCAQSVVGGTVRGATLHRIFHKTPHWAGRFLQLFGRGVKSAWVGSVTVLGLLSLLLPCAYPCRVRGFQLFMRQVPVKPQYTWPVSLLRNSNMGEVVLPIDVERRFELQLLTAAGIAFLLLAPVATVVALSRARRASRILAKAASHSGWVMLLLAGNLVLYLAVLEFLRRGERISYLDERPIPVGRGIAAHLF